MGAAVESEYANVKTEISKKQQSRNRAETETEQKQKRAGEARGGGLYSTVYTICTGASSCAGIQRAINGQGCYNMWRYGESEAGGEVEVEVEERWKRQGSMAVDE